MAWKYLNPGDYRLLNRWNSSYAVNYNSKSIAPVTGTAFSALYDSPVYPITIPAGTKEIWAAFSLSTNYVNNTNNGLPYISFYGATSLNYNKSVEMIVGAKYKMFYINKTNVLTLNHGSKLVALNRIWLHIKSGTSDGQVEICLNGQSIYSSSNINVIGGEDIMLHYFVTRYNDSYLSDIIISDEPIDLNEHVAVLPISLTSADGWSYDAINNVYTADSAGKTIWQVPDVNQLKQNVGLANPSITSVAIQAYNVATNDSSQVDTLLKQVKQNNQTVTDNSALISGTNYISPAMTVNPITNAAWTLSDLSSVQLGVTTAKA